MLCQIVVYVVVVRRCPFIDKAKYSQIVLKFVTSGGGGDFIISRVVNHCCDQMVVVSITNTQRVTIRFNYYIILYRIRLLSPSILLSLLPCGTLQFLSLLFTII